MKDDNSKKVKLDKKDIIRNTLIREVIRIDILRIMNMPQVIAKLRPILNKYGFEFESRNIGDVDLSVEDDDELETYDIKRNMDKWDNRKYLNKDEKFVLNENIIFFEKTNFCDYSGIEYYLEMMLEILEKIIETEREHDNFLYIDRIGVREVNRVTGKILKLLRKCLNVKILIMKEFICMMNLKVA